MRKNESNVVFFGTYTHARARTINRARTCTRTRVRYEFETALSRLWAEKARKLLLTNTKHPNSQKFITKNADLNKV